MKTFKFFFLLLSIAISIPALSQKPDDIILTIDNEPITKEAFEAIYRKNNKDTIFTQAELDEYMELFINFKLKVKEAEALGMDTAKTFIEELKGYREQLSRPYLVDSETTEVLMKEAYERKKTEVNASHILIKLPDNPTPADTLAAYNKIFEIKKRIDAGEDFEELAMQLSEDPSAKTNKGNIGYFSALQMVYPFENAAYNIKVGEVEGPVRTRYGYHLVKINDTRKAGGEVRVAHIMVRVEEADPKEVQENMKERIKEIQERLDNGEDFSILAKKFSDDRSTAAKGGELPPFASGKMVSEFENASFALENPGDISEPIRSPYGWHIIKLLEIIPLPTYEAMEKELKSRISKDSRSEITKNSFINKLKKEYEYTEFKKELKPFYSAVDTSIYSGNWNYDEKDFKKNKALFTLDGKTYRQQDFADYLVEHQSSSRQGANVNAYVDDSFNHWVNESIMVYENSRLEAKHPAFKSLINEYRDGILLFDLTDKKVWSRAVQDSAGLADFYEKYKEDFMWTKRLAVDIYTSPDMALANQVKKLLENGKNQDEVMMAVNKESKLNVKVESGQFEKGDRALLDDITWEKGIYGPLEKDAQVFIIQVKEVLPESPKQFNEARGIITAAYQKHLEEMWIKELRDKYEVEINKDVLYSIR